MYELSREPEKPFLIIKLLGVVGLDDYTQGMPELEQLIEETQTTRVLLDWTEMTGWEREAESVRFHARREIGNRLERVAVLAERDWDSEVRWAQETLNVPFRRFAPSDRQDALDWLESET